MKFLKFKFWNPWNSEINFSCTTKYSISNFKLKTFFLKFLLSLNWTFTKMLSLSRTLHKYVAMRNTQFSKQWSMYWESRAKSSNTVLVFKIISFKLQFLKCFRETWSILFTYCKKLKSMLNLKIRKQENFNQEQNLIFNEITSWE